MDPTAALLAVLHRPALRAELDRIGAAVGIPVVHQRPDALHRKTFAAAAAVVLDEEAADRCGHGRLPHRPHIVVATAAEPTAATWRAAVAVGAQSVLVLPDQAGELIGTLAEAGDGARGGPSPGAVVAVIGGRGGAGASLFATALALRAGPGLLIDLDRFGGGLDLLAGTEGAAGLRWPDLAEPGERLHWSAVRTALPSPSNRADLSVLSATRAAAPVSPAAAGAVVEAGRRGGVTVVCDLARPLDEPGETVLDGADLAVVLCPCDVRSGVAAAALVPRLRTINANIGLVVRGPAPGGLRAAEIAALTGLPLLAAMRPQPRLAEHLEHGGLRLRRRSPLAGAADRVLRLLRARPAVPA